MCARDRSQTTPVRQSESLSCINEVINFSTYPVCVRNSNGEFIFQNVCFEKEILGQNTSIDFWLSSLPLDVSLLLSKKELESFSQFDSFLSENEICINNRLWDVCFQLLFCNKEIYSAWHFFRPSSFCNNSQKNNFLYKRLEASVYDYRDSRSLLQWNALNMYLAGFSHAMISRILSISVCSSKNYTNDVHNFFKTSSKDELIISIYAEGYYVNVFKNVEKILLRNVYKLLSNQ